MNLVLQYLSNQCKQAIKAYKINENKCVQIVKVCYNRSINKTEMIMNYRKTIARRNRMWREPTGNSKDKWANSYEALKQNANAKEALKEIK